MGEDIEAEKQQLLERFLEFAGIFRSSITALDASYWSDAIDPTSGYTVFRSSTDLTRQFFGTQGGSGYSEVDGAQLFLKYSTATAGCCKFVVVAGILIPLESSCILNGGPQSTPQQFSPLRRRVSSKAY